MLLRRTPTQTASRHSAPLLVHELVSFRSSDDTLCNFERNFLHNFSNTRWMTGGHGALEEEATHRHEMLSPILSGRTLVGCRGQHHADVFLCRWRAAKFLKSLSKHSLVLKEMASRYHETLCLILRVWKRRDSWALQNFSKHSLVLLRSGKHDGACRSDGTP